ncbi:MAG: amino acid adenylation domain-containing protein, partial [Thermoanaerobaculia bacterium]
RLQIAAWHAETAVEHPRGGFLHELFEAQAARTPERTALIDGEERISYAELDRRADSLARRLESLGVGPEVAVGLCLARSADLVVAMFATLKAGGFYVPLDPNYPAERLGFIVEDSRCHVVLAHAGLLDRLPPNDAEILVLPVADLDTAPRKAKTVSGNLAYLIYTSGSTGRPKAVAIEHRSAVLLAHWSRAAFTDAEFAGVLASTSINFDMSVFEVFVTLGWGGTAILAENALALPRLPARDQVRLINTVPSAMAELLSMNAVPPSVVTVNLGGEAIPRALADRVYELAHVERLINLYGPSEDTTYSTTSCVGRAPDEPVLIGRPLHGTQAHIVDRHLRPLPVGVPGELYLGGEGLARGYFGRPEMTAEKFLPDPFSAEPGARFYRTGDLVRRRPEGDLDYLGRIDHQIKIRGFRVELGEIESALLAQPEIEAAVVLMREDTPGDRRLVAYVVSPGGEVSAPDLRRALQDRLPEYMVPQFFVRLDAIPLNPNGKVERKALPVPERLESTEAFVEPRTELERIVAEIWAEVLDVERVGLHDDFWDLGGHSLLATKVLARLSDTLGVEVPLHTIFEAPSLVEFTAALGEAVFDEEDDEEEPVLSLVALPRQEGAPLAVSFGQERLWFLDRYTPGASVYNIPAAYRLSGPLDAGALSAALAEIVRRHEVLRTVFQAIDGQPSQVVQPFRAPELPVVDLGGLSGAALEAEAARLDAGERARPFDLERGPVFRATLLRLGETEHVLLLNVHHIASDGWSVDVMMRELAALHGGASLPALPIQYADFALWQRRWLAGEVLEGKLDFWRRRLGGQPGPLALPADRPRPALQSFQGGAESLRLPESLAKSLERVGYENRATLFMTLLAAFDVLLYRWSGQEDLSVGMPIANRNLPEIQDLIGFFVNTLVLRTDVSGDPTFLDLLGRVRDVALDAFDHQDLPFDRLVVELAPERNPATTPLFQVLFTLRHMESGGLGLGRGVTAEPFAGNGGERTSKFDLSLHVARGEGEMAAIIEYAAALFDPATIQRMLGHLRTLLTAIAATPAARISDLPLLTPAERDEILIRWNDTRRDYPVRPFVHELFAEHARRHPDTVAVKLGDRTLSFGELEAQANRLAHHLRSLGVGPDVLVAVCAERTIERVVGIVATLKAGGAYASLDPDYPAERLAYLIEDARAPVLLTESRLLEKLPATWATVIRLDRDLDALAGDGDESRPPAVALDPDHLAYVIYTSGSTGRPKSVAVPHKGLLNLVLWHHETCGVTPEDRGTQVASPAFDVAVWELWPLLAGGAGVYIPDQETRLSSSRTMRWFAEEGITLAFLPTPLADVALGEEIEPGLDLKLRALVVGGDRLHRYPRPETPFGLLNIYGPAEHSVVTTAEWVPAMPREAAPARFPSIGRAVANTRVYLLDRDGRPVPAGVPGELYVSGPGLARGYLHRPELTAERFLPDPWEPGGRMYRIGDLARWLPDGSLDFLGRVDFQVKIRGMRVELGEIEAMIGQHPGVREAVVVVREDHPGDRRLTAYVAGAAEPRPAVVELKSFLERELPAYMVPQDWLLLDALPLTPNGKVDRRALPQPGRQVEAETAVAPRTPLEDLLASVFGQVFGLATVSVLDDFFDLGGHSLLATQVVSRVKAMGIDLEVRALFEEPTIEGLARWIQNRQLQSAGAAVPPLRLAPRGGEARPPLSFAQQRLWFLDQLEPGSPLYNIPAIFRTAGPLDAGALAGALETIVRRHDTLRTCFAKAGDEPVQVIAPADAPLGTVLPRIDLSALPADARERELERLIAAEVRRPFDLARGPLARFTLVRLAPEDHAVFLTLHHIISDGWSMGVLARELEALYGGHRLPELPLQYADYAAWQRGWFRDEILRQEIEHWRGRLGSSPIVLDLPADRPRPPVQSSRGGLVLRRVPHRLEERLETFSRKMGATPFIVLMAAFQALLGRFTNQPEVNVGTPIAGRTRTEIEGLIGFFVNTLVLRASLGGNPSFARLVALAREATLEAHAHQDLPFEKLVDALEPERSLSHAPVFQAMLVLQNESAGVALPGLRLTPANLHGGTAKFDLLLAVAKDHGMRCSLEYSRDLFDGATAARLLDAFETLLDAALAAPEAPFRDLPLLAEGTRAQLLREWNDTAVPVPFLTQHARFARQARHAPEAIAVAFNNEELTYAEMDARANRLAHRLKRLGVGPDVPVGLCLERSLDVPVALMAVLKAGGVLLPLDPSYPADRLAVMLADAGAPVLITEGELRGLFPDFQGEALRLEPLDLSTEPAEAPSREVEPEHLAYLIYTSGSTGRPKGIAMTHGALANLVAFHLGQPDAAFERTLQFSPLSFDVCFQETFSTWAAGGTLVLVSEDDRRDPVVLLDILERQRVSRLFLPFVALNSLAETAERLGARPSSLREVITAGEQLRSSDALVAWFRRMGACALENHYGPSELHAVSAFRLPSDPGAWPALPPIGRPILNTRVYLLDDGMRPVPLGVPGEAFLAGAQMARGYLGRPDLTAERFVPDPFSAEPGGRLYRSGDLARYLPDGNLEFLGRIDLQVKVRGFRIELGEVEAALAEHAEVREAVVAAPEIGGLKRLVAYVVPAGQAPEASDLKAFLEARLPAYMVPSHFVMLEALPMAAAGKVDRLALPLPEGRLDSGEDFVAPRTPLEELVAGIWCEVLGLDRIGVHDNFWDLGGHSLLATRALARVNEAFGVELPLQALFKAPTIAGFTVAIGDSLMSDED